MRRIAIVLAMIAFAAGMPAEAATPCRDANGKFIKCVPVKASKCRDAKGKFTACAPASGKAG